jgi:hypothetical protein
VINKLSTDVTLADLEPHGPADVLLSEILGAPGALSAPLYDPTFSRTVWRLYGGAEGLVMNETTGCLQGYIRLPL